jgi:UDP-N-acetylglucosamine 2-epimerase (non-hydrolysing)
MTLRVLSVVGTRPEAIKMAPVILRLRQEPAVFTPLLCATAQHRDMLDDVLQGFGLAPDVDLDLMRPGQSLNAVAAGVFAKLDDVLLDLRPDCVLIQGDTTTAMAASVVAFHRRVRIGHVEAGLRTGDLRQPFPEEMNRRVTDMIADRHFAPTDRAAETLLAEGVARARVHVTGNTVVDALLWTARHLPPGSRARPFVLVTSHRRESFGAPMRRTFGAIRRLAERFQDLDFVFPVHPNPEVLRAADEVLTGVANVVRIPPLGYRDLVALLRDARLVITDSGGIQEEAPAFGKPTLVLRESTERPEGVEAGVAILVGTDAARIEREATRLLTDDAAYRAMAQISNPYGDGAASDRIADALAGRPVAPFAPARREPHAAS